MYQHNKQILKKKEMKTDSKKNKIKGTDARSFGYLDLTTQLESIIA